MAIDTQAKRMAMLNWSSGPSIVSPGLIADGTISSPDEAHLLNLYGGNAWAFPVPAEAFTLAVKVRHLLSQGVTARSLLSQGVKVRHLLSLGVKR